MIRDFVRCAITIAVCYSTQSWGAPHPLSPKPVKSNLTNSSPANFPEGERAIYTRVLESYRKNDSAKLTKFRDLLIKNYPSSIYADNTLYLSGLYEFQRGRLAESIKNLGMLTTKYPRGNKRPAALYLKSVAYSKLALAALSRKMLEQIVEEYPGSPESQRAWMDLRLLKKSKS